MSLSAPVSTKEDMGRYLQELKHLEQVDEGAFPEELRKLETPRELRFEQDISRLFRDAWWIAKTGHFPDGEPMRKQHPVVLMFWQACMDAMERRQWGVKPDDKGGE